MLRLQRGCVALVVGCGTAGPEHEEAPLVAGGNKSGCLVPLYAYPTDPSYARLIALKEQASTVPVLAVINPGTTGAGPRRDPAFADGITRLGRAGIEVAGYVSLGYGARTRGEVESELAHYRAWYPAIHTIFYDEVATDESALPEHAKLVDVAHAQGFDRVLANPGTTPPPALAELFDVTVVYESPGLPSLELLAQLGDTVAAGKLAALAYDVAALDGDYLLDAVRHVSYVFVTDDVLDNPYDTLPPYLHALLTQLESLAAASE